MSSFVGPLALTHGGHFMSVTSLATQNRYPTDGLGGSTTVSANSHTRTDPHVLLVGLYIISSAAAGNIEIQALDLSVLFRIVYPAAISLALPPLYVPFGRGVIVPSGFSAQASAASTIYSLRYRRIEGKRYF